MTETAVTETSSFQGLLMPPLSPVSSQDAAVLADGLMRPWMSGCAPSAFARIMKDRGWGEPPTCDLVVIGGGPSGIAAAVTAIAKGLRVCLVEQSCFAESFSDSRAQPVHVLRTNAEKSSLFNPALVPKDLSSRFDLRTMLSKEERAELRDYLEEKELLEHRKYGPFDAALGEGVQDSRPLLRIELYGYLIKLLDFLNSTPECALLERAGNARYEKDSDGMFTVTSEKGHVVRASRVMYAPGIVKREEMTDKIPKIFSGMFVNTDEHQDYQPTEGRAYRWSDLGTTRMREYLEQLGPDKRAVVVGNGESAVKCAIEVCELNKTGTTTLIVKYLYPSQTHMPAYLVQDEDMKVALSNPEIGRKTSALTKECFGTPVTPATLLELFSLVQEGRLRIIEAGRSIDEPLVRCAQNGESTQIVLNAEAAGAEDFMKSLAKSLLTQELIIPAGQKERLREITRTGILEEFSGPVFLACGYSSPKEKGADGAEYGGVAFPSCAVETMLSGIGAQAVAVIREDSPLHRQIETTAVTSVVKPLPRHPIVVELMEKRSQGIDLTGPEQMLLLRAHEFNDFFHENTRREKMA